MSTPQWIRNQICSSQVPSGSEETWSNTIQCCSYEVPQPLGAYRHLIFLKPKKIYLYLILQYNHIYVLCNITIFKKSICLESSLSSLYKLQIEMDSDETLQKVFCMNRNILMEFKFSRPDHKVKFATNRI